MTTPASSVRTWIGGQIRDRVVGERSDLAAAAVSLLLSWTRWPLRLPYRPISEVAVVRPAGDAITSIIRWSMAG